MEENKLTAREIFEKIAELQKQITGNSNMSLHSLGDAISSAFEDEDGNDGNRDFEQIAEICDVFKTRELHLLKLLELYEKMYDDVQKNERKVSPEIRQQFLNFVTACVAASPGGVLPDFDKIWKVINA